MTRRFTGWHMLAILVAFFGVVIGVNLTMATLASRSFGGLVVANSYVASQHYNEWLAEARKQRELGWSARVEAADGRLTVSADAANAPLAGATVTAVAAHPLGRVPEVALRFRESAPGRYEAEARLPEGRWRLHLSLARDGRRADFLKEVAW
ncbi:MAG: FixH family protein [Sphingomonas sp.]